MFQTPSFQNKKTLAFRLDAYYNTHIDGFGKGRILGREARQKNVIAYAGRNGVEPFTIWLEGLRDAEGRRRILVRITRVACGNYGDCAPVGDGVSELRLFFGPGYRIYFGEHENDVVVLLCGGDKGTQEKDIRMAKELWKEYLNNAHIQNI